jgi:hypothetical protein
VFAGGPQESFHASANRSLRAGQRRSDGATNVNAAIKSLARRALPASLRRQIRWIVAAARYGMPESVLHFGQTPGDDLLCTAVLRELRKRGGKNIWMISKYPELFRGSGDLSRVVPADQAQGSLNFTAKDSID